MSEATKILVVEDEYITAKTISNFLTESGYNVVGCAMNLSDTLALLKNETIDCVILDININDEKDGIWIAQHINENYKIPFIYLTAYSDSNTVRNAIETSPYGFLSKPFQKAELYSAIEIALYKHNELLALREKAIDENTSEKRSLFLKHVDKFDRVELNDIIFVESQKNYLFVHTRKIVYKHRGTIKEFIKYLSPIQFIKTHRAFIVNIERIDHFDVKDNIITMGNNRIPVSQTFRREFLDRLG